MTVTCPVCGDQRDATSAHACSDVVFRVVSGFRDDDTVVVDVIDPIEEIGRLFNKSFEGRTSPRREETPLERRRRKGAKPTNRRPRK